ncbi:hypothetical protein [Streptomyces sp. NBC_01237]|uniref:hypothetical protein n=1 Tax=Streptomyces sp. NBC_01237 TaxID=2903790 RepID=UPI002DDACADA|nr:hypothetical protein [Streptomyces sp. NBC_01237]WRZ77283.1 hypothetical protein OG251_37140 [Streptomyces sp. NBC_01237]
MPASQQHFTAWFTDDPSVSDKCVLDIFKDEIVGYETGLSGFTTDEPVWGAAGRPILNIPTAMDVNSGRRDTLRQAEQLLRDAGWEAVGGWSDNQSGYTITVEQA